MCVCVNKEIHAQKNVINLNDLKDTTSSSTHHFQKRNTQKSNNCK